MAGPQVSERIYEVKLDDGRVIQLQETNERRARDAAYEWARTNPAGSPIQSFQVGYEGATYEVPAVSQEAAEAYMQARGPAIRARELSTERKEAAGAMRDIPFTEADESRVWDATDNVVNAFTFGLDKLSGAGIEAGLTGISNLGERLGIGEGSGTTMGEAFNASRSVQNQAQSDYRRERPIEALGTGLLGAVANPVSQAGAGFALGRGGGTGLMGALNSTRLPAVAARSGVLGGAYGAVEGGLNANPGEELEDAQRGAIIGGLTGGAAPVAGRAASATARATGLDQIPAVLNRVTGGRIPALAGSTDRRAMNRLAEAMRTDNLDPAVIRTAMNDAMRYGVTPNLLDLIGPNATRTRALVVGAAQAPGPGMTAGAQYRNEVASNLPDEAVGSAYRLTPGETRSSAAYIDDLANNNRQIADATYEQPYQARVPLTPEARRALADMNPAMTAARQESSFRFPAQAADIDAMAAGQATDVSAAALDRINRQIGQAGRNAAIPGDSQNPGLAADFGARSGAIDEILENVPGLAPARGAYRGYSNATEATKAGSGALAPNTRPANYIDDLARMEQVEARAEMAAGIPVPGTRQSAGIGLRDELVQRLGRAREGATGPLNDLASRAEANNARQVLEATYGEAPAEAFQGGMGMLRDRMALANFMDSTRGSPTAGRLEAANMPGMSATLSTAMSILSKIRRGVTMTDADREALIRLSTQFGNVPMPNLLPRGAPVSGRAAIPLGSQLQASGRE